MKIEFDREELAGALSKVGAVVERKTTMPILGNLLMEASGNTLSISATDLEIGIRSECPVNVIAEGRICVPARSLVDIVKELPDRNGRLKKGENEWMLLESGKAHFRVVGVIADEFPQMLSPNSFKFTRLKTDILRDAIGHTAFAISTDEVRYQLNGAFVEIAKGEKTGSLFRMVATDSHRLALSSAPLKEEETITLKKGIILPRKGIAELRRLLESADDSIEVAFTDTNAAFRIGGTVIYMRLVVGDFPDYNAVIPKGNKKKLMIDRGLFTSALRRVSLLSEGKSRCIRFELSKNGVRLAANSPDLGEAEESLPAEFEGDDLQIGFNARYLLDALSVMVGDKVTLELDAEQSPGILREVDHPGTLYVVMPMRI